MLGVTARGAIPLRPDQSTVREAVNGVSNFRTLAFAFALAGVLSCGGGKECSTTDTSDIPRCCTAETSQGESGSDSLDSADTAEQFCDGFDNDHDGTVDEGHPDTDLDGMADCVDTMCEVALPPPEDLAEHTTCTIAITPSADPWNIELVWTSGDDFSCQDDTVVADVDHDGTSDILCVSPVYGSVRAYSGVDGAVLWETGNLNAAMPDLDESVGWNSPIAIADIEGDGRLDIFVLSDRTHPARLDESGGVVWHNGDVTLATDGGSANSWPYAMEIADLDETGQPAVLTNAGVFSPVDGHLLFPLMQESWPHDWYFSFDVINAPESGGSLILNRDQGWDRQGNKLWDLGIASSWRLVSPVVLQADADEAPEIAYVYTEGVTLVDETGSATASVPLDPALYTAGLTSAGDVDGDGEMEFVFTSAYSVSVWNGRLEEEWSHDILDLTITFVGSTTFDFDLDGQREVLTSDQDSFYILDGGTGDLRFQDNHVSGTGGDSVLVVDLDGDGPVEIVVTSMSNDQSLTVYRNRDHDWPPGTRIWPAPAWAGTSRNQDLTIPRTPEAPWLTTQVWRGQPTFLVPGSDLRPEVVAACVPNCEGGDLHLALRLVNRGPEELRDGAPLAVFLPEGSGGWALHGVVQFPGFVDNGHASAGMEYVLPMDRARSGVRLVAGDDGTGTILVGDCDPSNNTTDYLPDFCSESLLP